MTQRIARNAMALISVWSLLLLDGVCGRWSFFKNLQRNRHKKQDELTSPLIDTPLEDLFNPTVRKRITDITGKTGEEKFSHYYILYWKPGNPETVNNGKKIQKKDLGYFAIPSNMHKSSSDAQETANLLKTFNGPGSPAVKAELEKSGVKKEQRLFTFSYYRNDKNKLFYTGMYFTRPPTNDT